MLTHETSMNTSGLSVRVLAAILLRRVGSINLFLETQDASAMACHSFDSGTDADQRGGSRPTHDGHLQSAKPFGSGICTVLRSCSRVATPAACRTPLACGWSWRTKTRIQPCASYFLAFPIAIEPSR